MTEIDMKERTVPAGATPAPEAGFTLIEALAAIVILVFGLMGITNLLLVAANSNTTANQGTAAATVASQVLENIKAVPYTALNVNGSGVTVTADQGGGGPCFGTGAVLFSDPATNNNCDAAIQGVGNIHARWVVTALAGNNQVRFVQVRAEATGVLGAARTRAEFTTFRSCTSTTLGCPAP